VKVNTIATPLARATLHGKTPHSFQKESSALSFLQIYALFIIMNKDFKNWHHRKEHIHKNSPQVFFHEREIWWCSLGLNIGFEQDGNGPEFQRPVIILRKFNNDVCWVLPITTKPKTGKYYFPIDLGDKIERRVILSQLRLIDGKRFLDKIATLPEDQFSKLDKAVKAL